jgi:hypothetical protein
MDTAHCAQSLSCSSALSLRMLVRNVQESILEVAPRRRRLGAHKAKLMEIQLFNKDIDHAYRVVFSNIGVKTLGQQRNLSAAFAFDESLHAAAPKKPRTTRIS